jgi:hypothetical protein
VEATIRLGHPAALALGHSVSRAAALLRDRLGPGRSKLCPAFVRGRRARPAARGLKTYATPMSW